MTMRLVLLNLLPIVEPLYSLFNTISTCFCVKFIGRTSSRIFLLFGILLVVTMLCDPMLGQVLTKSSNAAQSYLKKMSYEISSGFEEAFERNEEEKDDDQEEEEEEEEEVDKDNNLPMPGNVLSVNELDIIRRSIVQGLGLQRIPDPSKANVSQTEYERAHRDYLRRVQYGGGFGKRRKFHAFSAADCRNNGSMVYANEDSLLFRLNELYNSIIDHATLRMYLDGSTYGDYLKVNVYSIDSRGARLLTTRKTLQLYPPKDSRWFEFDFTDAMSIWFRASDNFNLELEFQDANGRRISRTSISPVLNIFTTRRRREKRHAVREPLNTLHKGRRTDCRNNQNKNKKCCRHELTIVFKDLKGFEFIIQPKTFDAGYCKGRCPPRYNPAHHHALLQSLIWQEDRKKVPKPCCAPSKLAQLEILYFDENDSTKLKVSNWKNMIVVECACS